MRKMLLRVMFVMLVGLASVATSKAQDFQKSYRLGAGADISIRNVSGDIKVVGYDGDAIVVSGFKEGQDRDVVEIEDKSGANSVDIGVRYPRARSTDASVRFEVRVPRGINYEFDSIQTASGNIELQGMSGTVKANTASGDVTVSDVAGSIKANTASGNVRVRNVAGSIQAGSASGNVDVEMGRLDGVERMEFSSASGDVSVKLPSDLDADVQMSSATGSLHTNFPLKVQKEEYGAGMWARGTLGSGSRRLRISSASGDVRLTTM